MLVFPKKPIEAWAQDIRHKPNTIRPKGMSDRRRQACLSCHIKPTNSHILHEKELEQGRELNEIKWLLTRLVKPRNLLEEANNPKIKDIFPWRTR